MERLYRVRHSTVFFSDTMLNTNHLFEIAAWMGGWMVGDAF